MTKYTRCFDYICEVLDFFGERSVTNIVAVGGLYVGPSTEKVIRILFDDFDNLDGVNLGAVNFHNLSAPRLYTIREFGKREEELSFSDCKETFEIIKKIQHELFKTELERLMYPLPEITFKDKELA